MKLVTCHSYPIVPVKTSPKSQSKIKGQKNQPYLRIAGTSKSHEEGARTPGCTGQTAVGLAPAFPKLQVGSSEHLYVSNGALRRRI